MKVGQGPGGTQADRIMLWEVHTPMEIDEANEVVHQGDWHVFTSRFAMEMWLVDHPHLRRHVKCRWWSRKIYDYERWQVASDYIFHL